MENVQTQSFWRQVLSLALPVAAQGLLYAVLGIVNQIMVGEKGEASVVAVSLAGKTFGILNFALMGLTAGLGILAAQHIGKNQAEKIAKIQGMVLFVGLLISLAFTLFSLLLPELSMRLFTADPKVVAIGVPYLRWYAWAYLPVCIMMIYSTTLRAAGLVKLPMVAGFIAVLIEAGLNYCLIFGNFGFPELGVTGAGLAGAISVWVELAILMLIIYIRRLPGSFKLKDLLTFYPFDAEIHQLWLLTLPLLGDNLSFVLADSISGSIYGYMGTVQTVAVTIMMPVQLLLITFFGGFSSAASVMIGHRLGRDEMEHAYKTGKQILWLSLIAPLIFGFILLLGMNPYLAIYHLSAYSLSLTRWVMLAMVLFIPMKVMNMVLGSVLGAGGETKFIFYISLLGGWIFAVPLGLLTAFVLHWSIIWVFTAITSEEIVRVLLGLWKMRQRTWLNNLVS